MPLVDAEGLVVQFVKKCLRDRRVWQEGDLALAPGDWAEAMVSEGIVSVVGPAREYILYPLGEETNVTHVYAQEAGEEEGDGNDFAPEEGECCTPEADDGQA